MVPLSIITRAYKTSELKMLIDYLNSNNETKTEIVAVCNINDYDIKNSNIIIEDSNRFEARITGIKNAIYDKLLLLDSDQIPERGLLRELDNKEESMVIIPEQSVNKNFTSICLDDWRCRNESLARERPNPYIPVIPRFYKKTYLLSAVNKISANICKIIDHEDSILYYYVFEETKNIEFSKKRIFNYDPNLLKLMHKAYLYGKNSRDIKQLVIPENISLLLKNLNRNTFNVKELGFGKGYILQLIRGISYELGKVLS